MYGRIDNEGKVMARVSDSTREAQQVDQVTAQIREYNSVKKEADRLAKRQKELRDSLMETIKYVGYEDDQGHYWLELEEPIDGVVALQGERRVSRGLDEEAAAEIFESLGLTETCYKTVQVVDEDAVYSALYEDKLTDADIDTIFPQKIVWALKVK
jgi:hemerythrin superfamily protein